MRGGRDNHRCDVILRFSMLKSGIWELSYKRPHRNFFELFHLEIVYSSALLIKDVEIGCKIKTYVFRFFTNKNLKF